MLRVFAGRVRRRQLRLRQRQSPSQTRPHRPRDHPRQRLRARRAVPAYTKNLDDKINFQPKLLKGKSARKMLARLRDANDAPVEGFRIEGDRAVVHLNGADKARP
ncbi:MAG: hypothetical protein B7733_03290 [Myxococcales bacterium FL481]|nr:MAG: hypothetical protein B7733_03290 [Myxococcales bacterium FL481]